MIGGMKTRWSWVLAGLLFIGALPGAARADVIGRDDRKPLPPKLEQVLGNAIGLLVYRVRDGKGRLVPKKVASCTATCVGRRTILTSAHCVMKVRGHSGFVPDLGTMRFILWPGDRKRVMVFDLAGFPSDAARRRFMVAGPGNKKAFNGERSMDWALLPLEAGRACPARLRMAPVKARDKRLRKGHPLMLVGFHGDLLKRGIRKLRYSVCQALADKYARRIARRERRRTGQSVLVHDCDATKGASGSPMLVRSKGKPLIAAVFSGSNKFGRVYRNRRTGKVVKRKILRRMNVAAPAENIIPALKRMKARRETRREIARLRWQERLMVSTGVLVVSERGKNGKWRLAGACTAACTGPHHVIVPARCIRNAGDAMGRRMVFVPRPHVGRKQDMSRAIVEKVVSAEGEEGGLAILYLTRSLCRPAVPPVKALPEFGRSGKVFVAGFNVCGSLSHDDMGLRQVTCRGVMEKGRGGRAPVELQCKGTLPTAGGVMVMADERGRPRLLGLVAPERVNVGPCRTARRNRTKQGRGLAISTGSLPPVALR